MSIQEVVVFPREKLGKAEAGRLRRSGLTPCVVYGMGGETKPVSVEPKVVNMILRSEKGLNSVLSLKMENTDHSRHVMIRSVDRHPVSEKLLHIDFMRIDMDRKIMAVIPIVYEGEPIGAKQGGLITTVRHKIEVECLPGDVPGAIHVDVSNLDLDQALRVRDLPTIEGVVFQLEPQRTIAVMHLPEQEEEEEAEEEEEELEVVAEETESEE